MSVLLHIFFDFFLCNGLKKKRKIKTLKFNKFDKSNNLSLRSTEFLYLYTVCLRISFEKFSKIIDDFMIT